MLDIRWCTKQDVPSLIEWIGLNRSKNHIFSRSKSELEWFYSAARLRKYIPLLPDEVVLSMRLCILERNIVGIQGLLPFSYRLPDGDIGKGLWLAMIGSDQAGNKALAGLQLARGNELLGFDLLSAIDVNDMAQKLYHRLGYAQGANILKYILTSNKKIPFQENRVHASEDLDVRPVSLEDISYLSNVNQNLKNSVIYDEDFLRWKFRVDIKNNEYQVYKITRNKLDQNSLFGYFDNKNEVCVLRLMMINMQHVHLFGELINCLKKFLTEMGINSVEYYDSDLLFGDLLVKSGFIRVFNDGNNFPRFINPVLMGGNYINSFFKGDKSGFSLRITSLDSDIIRPR